MNHPENQRALAAILDQLACPVCLAALSLEANALVCTGCRRTYPIQDGIPVLIASPDPA